MNKIYRAFDGFTKCYALQHKSQKVYLINEYSIVCGNGNECVKLNDIFTNVFTYKMEIFSNKVYRETRPFFLHIALVYGCNVHWGFLISLLIFCRIYRQFSKYSYKIYLNLNICSFAHRAQSYHQWHLQPALNGWLIIHISLNRLCHLMTWYIVWYMGVICMYILHMFHSSYTRFQHSNSKSCLTWKCLRMWYSICLTQLTQTDE